VDWWKGQRHDRREHHRVGIDAQKAEMAGLVRLLIDKGILTLEEYLVSIRLAMNEELARYTDHCREK